MKSSSRLLTDSKLGKLLVDLANTPDGSISAFRHTWGVPSRLSDERLLTLRDQLRYVWGGPRELDAEVGMVVKVVSNRVDPDDNLWEQSDRSKSLEQLIIEDWLTPGRNDPPFTLQWTKTIKRIHPNLSNLPVVLAHGVVQFANRLKYCGNLDCRT
jgi:hypothetical protein